MITDGDTLDILEAVARGRKKPTHIMYRANLSWSRLTKQLEFLLEQELLERTEENGTVYRITLKGKEILEYSNKIKRNLYPKERILPIQVYVQTK